MFLRASLQRFRAGVSSLVEWSRRFSIAEPFCSAKDRSRTGRVVERACRIYLFLSYPFHLCAGLALSLALFFLRSRLRLCLTFFARKIAEARYGNFSLPLGFLPLFGRLARLAPGLFPSYFGSALSVPHPRGFSLHETYMFPRLTHVFSLAVSLLRNSLSLHRLPPPPPPHPLSTFLPTGFIAVCKFGEFVVFMQKCSSF